MKTRILGFLLGLLMVAAPVAAQNSVVTLGCAGTIVNCIQITGGKSGTSPVIQPVGPDSNLNITIQAKGTGTVTVTGSSVAYTVSTTTGRLTDLQAVGGDLTLVGTGLGHTGGFLAGGMFSVLGASGVTSVTNGANTAGLIARYAVSGTSYTPGYARAALYAEAAGASDGAVVAAVSDADNFPITVRAYYTIDYQIGNSPSSAVQWYADYQGSDAATGHDVYGVASVTKADIRLGGKVNGVAAGNDVCWPLRNAGAPTSGAAGTGFGTCGPGSLLVDTTNKFLYINTNTLASPTWTKVGLQS